MELAAAIAVVFAINLLPAFGPPTWAVLVFFRLTYDVPAVPLILLGAVAAALGRLTLAAVTRHFRGRLPESKRANLKHAAAASLGDVFQKVVASPTGIVLQIVMLALLVALYRVDWVRIANRRRSGTSSAKTTASIAPAANASDSGSSERTSSTST